MITSQLTKIMEKVMLNKLEELGSKLLYSGSYQAGFKKHTSTQKNVTILLNQILKSRSKRKDK